MRIDSYSFGEIVIGGKKYTTDVVVFPDKVKPHWWRKKGHEINPEDIEEILEEKPELVVFGTGAHGLVEVKEETKKLLRVKGIEFVEKITPEACEYYNKKKSEKMIVAALHLTC